MCLGKEVSQFDALVGEGQLGSDWQSNSTFGEQYNGRKQANTGHLVVQIGVTISIPHHDASKLHPRLPQIIYRCSTPFSTYIQGCHVSCSHRDTHDIHVGVVGGGDGESGRRRTRGRSTSLLSERGGGGNKK